MAAAIEITAVYLGERFRFSNVDGDTIIADARIVAGEKPPTVNGKATIKGMANEDELEHGATYRLYGHWIEYTNRRTSATESQFHFQSFTEAAPLDRSGIVSYLQKLGEGCGIGQARAERLWKEFGQDAVRVAREEPETLRSLFSLSAEQSTTLADRLAKNLQTEAVSIEIVQLLARRGFPKATAKRALDLWGNAAPRLIQHDPYKLMTFRGCGFKKCDAMYMSLKLPAHRMKRQALCAWYAIAQATKESGDTWHSATVAIKAVERTIGGAELDPVRAIQLCIRAGMLDRIRTDGPADAKRFVDRGGQLWLAEATKAKNERFIARHLADATDEQPSWPDIPSAALSEHQRDALRAATRGMVGLLIGSPGTGKTYSAAAIIQAIIAAYGADQIIACAPTGKAAVRLTEALAGYQIDLRARTIHSTLGVDPFASTTGGGWRFKHNEGNPLKARFVVVDESSMIDADLGASLLAARAKGTHFLFVGDVNQLLPVGHGAPLRDMIAAGLPCGELREIRRNSGMIVQACADIRDGKRFEVSHHVDLDEGRNLLMVDAGSPDQQIAAMKSVLATLADDDHGLNPVWDCQVLAAVNAKSALSRKELNKILQAELNNRPGLDGSPFRVGDKIVNTKNGYYTLDSDWAATSPDREFNECDIDDRGQAYVANGEIAEVLSVEEKLIVARLDTPTRTIRIPRGKATLDDTDDDSASDDDATDKSPQTGCSWDLAYALSTHKAQGSEFPVVVVMLDEYAGARKVCDRAWIYTAISRGKKLCVLIGRKETAERFCKVNRINQRRTWLSELFTRERAEKILGGM